MVRTKESYEHEIAALKESNRELTSIINDLKQTPPWLKSGYRELGSCQSTRKPK